MKRLFTLLSSVLLTSAAFAQIPNPSFENWTTSGTAHNATGWGNLNANTGTFGVYTCDSGMITPPDGMAFIKLTSKTVTIPIPPTSPTTFVAPGVAFTGSITVVPSPFSYSFSGGFPNTTRPQSLKGKFQHMGGDLTDHGRIVTVLSKWNTATNKRDTVAISDTTLTGMAMSWSDFTFPLTYKKGIFPDSAAILLSSSAVTPVAGSYLWVDNLSFFGSVASVNPFNNPAHSAVIYPNPASGTANVAFYSSNGTDVTFCLYDISGKMIKSITSHTVRGNNDISIDLKGCAQGMYIVKIIDESGTVEQKLMVE